jgi:hypothetical protein
VSAAGQDRCKRHRGEGARALRRGAEDGSDRGTWYAVKTAAGDPVPVTPRDLARARRGEGPSIALTYAHPDREGRQRTAVISWDLDPRGAGREELRAAVLELYLRLVGVGIPAEAIEVWETQHGAHVYVTARELHDAAALRAWARTMVSGIESQAMHVDVCHPTLRLRATPGTRLVDRDLKPVNVAQADDVAWIEERLLSGQGRADLRALGEDGPELGPAPEPRWTDLSSRGAPPRERAAALDHRVDGGRGGRGDRAGAALVHVPGARELEPLGPEVHGAAYLAHVDQVLAGAVERGSLGAFRAASHVAKRYVLGLGVGPERYAAECQSWAARCTEDRAARRALADLAAGLYGYWRAERERRGRRVRAATGIPARVQTPLRLEGAGAVVEGCVAVVLEGVREPAARRHAEAWARAAFATLAEDGDLDRTRVQQRYAGPRRVRVEGRLQTVADLVLGRLGRLGAMRRVRVAAPSVGRPELWWLDYAWFDAQRAFHELPAVVLPEDAARVRAQMPASEHAREQLDELVRRMLVRAAVGQGAELAAVLERFRARGVLDPAEVAHLGDVLPLYRLGSGGVGLDFRELRLWRAAGRRGEDPAAVLGQVRALRRAWARGSPRDAPGDILAA